MALDIRKWLKDDLGFTDAELTPELVALMEPRAPKIEQGYKRQSDYSREMDGLTAQRTELAAANDRLQAEMVEWGQLTAAEKANSKTLQDSLNATQQEVLRLTQSVTTLATNAGVDPATILKPTGATTVTTPAPGAPDMTGYVRKEDLTGFGAQLNGVAEMALTLPATLNAIAIEHEQLTGQKLDTRTIIAEIRKRAGTRGNQLTLDPEAIWMEQHQVADKRTAAATKAHDDEIAAAEERGRNAARTEALVPGAHSAHAHARIFNNPAGERRTSILQRPQPGTIAQGAAAALATGKYKAVTTTPGGNTLPAGGRT